MTAAMLIFGLLTVLSACGVVLSRKPLNSALCLVVTLFLVAVHFALLGADFIAVIQVLVYAGAIMVLVIFVIMLLGIDVVSHPTVDRWGRLLAGAFTGVFAGVLIVAVQRGVSVAVYRASAEDELRAVSGEIGTAAVVGQALFTRFIYPFEIASLLLLAGIVGAVVLALEAKRPLRKDRGLAAMHRGN